MRRKAVKSSIFMFYRSVRIPLPLGSGPEQLDRERGADSDDGEFPRRARPSQPAPRAASPCSAYFVNGQP
jgi:hypothetical protein